MLKERLRVSTISLRLWCIRSECRRAHRKKQKKKKKKKKNLLRVTSQKTEDLIFTAAETRSHTT
jgi:hypothetical protein